MTLLKNNESQSQNFFSSESPPTILKKVMKVRAKNLVLLKGQGLPTTKSNESQTQKHFSSQGQKVNYKKEASIKKRFAK